MEEPDAEPFSCKTHDGPLLGVPEKHQSAPEAPRAHHGGEGSCLQRLAGTPGCLHEGTQLLITTTASASAR